MKRQGEDPLGLPLDAELVNPETQVQVHSLPRASQPAPQYNQLDDEEPAVPSHHKSIQKDGGTSADTAQTDCEGH